MSLWSSFRRFSRAKNNEDSGTARFDSRSRSNNLQSLKHRDLRLEQFEQRLLLSITPNQSYLDDAYMDVEDAWDTATGMGVVVAVIDDGIDSGHSELETYRSDLSWDFMTDTAVAGPQLATDNHGTAVAGIIASTNNGTGTIGAIATGTYTTAGGTTTAAATIAPFVSPGLNNDFAIESPVALGAVNDVNVAIQYVAQPDDPATAVWDGVDTLTVTIEPGITVVNDLVAVINDAQTSGSPLEASVYNDGSSPSGIAYNAELASYRLTSLDPNTPLDNTMVSNALGTGLDVIDIYNVNLNQSVEMLDPGDDVVGTMRRGATEGRNGLGSIYVYGAGDAGGNANYDALVKSRYSIAVGSAYDSNDDGVLDSVLSAPGSAVLVSGIAGANGILTTDRTGDDGYEPGDYTSTDYEGFGGVQAAAAQISGVVALMLDANSTLTYRDVQQILVESSSNWNAGAGTYDSDGLGWGTVNARAAVEAAAGWDSYVAPEAVAGSGLKVFNPVDNSPVSNPDGDPATHDSYIEASAEIASDIGSIEWVEVTLYGLFEGMTPADKDWGGNEIKLTSPSGVESYLTRPHTPTSDVSMDDGWTFTSAAHWGDASGGEWKLTLSNPQTGIIGTWGAWDLKVYGQENAGGDTGPELVKIIPNQGGELVDGEVVNVAPRELILQFNSQQDIDPTTLDAIQIVRSGGDDTFGDGNEQTIVPGYIAKGDQDNEVIIRFAETLPDDEYRLTIIGDETNSPLRNIDGVAFNGGSDTTIRFTLDLGAQVVSVVPQPVYRGPLQVTAAAIDAANDGDTFTVSDGFHEVTFEFNRSNDLLTGGVDNVTTGNIPIRFDAAGATATQVAQLIHDHIGADAITPGLLDSDLIDVTLNGDVVELSGRWAAISPVAALGFDVLTVQKLQQATDKVDVYFNDDDLDPALAEDVSFYRLYRSVGGYYTPAEVFYDPVQDKAQLRFAFDLPSDTYHLEIGAPSTPAYNNYIYTGDNTISSFDVPNHEAQDIGSLDIGSYASASVMIFGGAIDRAYWPTVQPGASDEPGHREIPIETHLNDAPKNFAVYEYNFQDDYGWSTPNQIEENQKQRAREVLEIYAHYLGVEFRETASSGLTIVTGDLRSVLLTVPTGPGGVAGISEGTMYGKVVMDAAENWGQSEYGGAWFETAMHEIGHSLGLGHTYDMPAKTIMGEWGTSDEPVFPGNVDLLHAQYLYPAASNEVNLFKFDVAKEGWFTAETQAERLLNSALDTKLVLYREYDVLGTAVREVIASNDDYYSDDSFIGLNLEPGTYYIGVMSTGMTDVDPTMENSGFGGTSEGSYYLTLEFVPTPTTTLADETGTHFDGDADGVAGGTYDFWFHVGDHTLFVDKTDPADGGLGDDLVSAGDSSLYAEIDDAIANASADDVIRVVGNDDDTPFLVGYSNTSTVLEDGALIQLPADVTMMVDAGAIFKLQAANLDIGSSAQGISRAGSALQVLGTPMEQVHFRSFRDDSIGGDSDGASTGQAGGDWGGLVFRDDSDREGDGIYLNSVSFADIQHGGGEVLVDSVRDNYSAIHMIAARPTIAHNVLRYNAGGAISADLTSFEEADGRIGPDIHGNTVLNNTIDGLFVRIETEFGKVVDHLTVPARWDDTDIVHVVTENLLIQGTPGGELNGTARLDARLRIDPATIVKLEGARIQAEIAGQLIAEGLPGYPVVFTSLRDDTYGMAGGFDTTNDGDSNPAYPGQWGGLVFSPTSKGALDYLYVAYAGGETSLGGEFEAFNTIEIHQADVRIANSYFTKNAEGGSTSNRDGLGATEAATIFVRGAQPVILNNTFVDNNNIRFPNTEAIDDVGDIISIDVNSLTTSRVPDPGRSTGYANIFTEVADNLGPLVRYNRLDNNDVNSFAIRGGVLTTESVWDDTDIVHVVREEIEILNQHTFGGLRLQSSPTESLVVKLSGADTGFTADGVPLDIDDRIGGTLEIIGQPNNPVVLTSLNDLTIGAGFTPDGRSMKDTLNVGLILDAGAATPYVDVIVVIDESGSMGYVQEFTEQLIPQLDAALTAAGIGDGTLGDNRFGLVGFGGDDGSFFGTGNHLDAHSHLLNGNIWGTASEYVTAAQGLVTNGGWEDGWDGIQYAVDNYDFRSDATKFVILATDEPRYEQNPSVSYNSVLTSLQDEGVILEGILGVGIEDGANQTALALDTDGTAFLEDVNGGFTTSPGGHFLYSWFQSIITDYANMAFATGGLVGDIDMIGQGGNTTDSFANAMISQILVQAGAGNPAGAGDWRSVQINEYANTRNVAVATEVEPSYLVDGGTNDTAVTAQVLGHLAPDLASDANDDEKAGDENLRLGFEVHGHISMNDAADVDVYSFEAEPGTEVWIDIDRTSFGLDAMVELIQADDTWLARSRSNTNYEYNTTITPPVIPTSLITDSWLGRDFYTNNTRDPAMHLVLPGTIGGPTQNYFLRVSSENGTSGEYEMQVRLRQVDEAAGSTVRYAEIRYATDGIEVNGQPGHSILSGEATETPNNNNNWSNTSVQDLGNLLTSDRNTISVAGNLSAQTDVDWYKFSLDYDLIQAIGSLSDGAKTWSTIFDIDYGDGLSRADMVLSVYDSDGNLILVSRDSNIEDDQPSSGTGNDLDDLSRGSVGTFDPYIGSVQMPAGVIPVGTHREYYVAITSNLQLPSVLQATFEGNNTNSTALYRLEPVNSVQRVAEDHIDFQGHMTGRFGYSASERVLPDYNLFSDVDSAVSLATNVVPYTFSDVVLFVSTNEGTDHLRTLNPFTGERVTDVGTLNGTHGASDIAMRGDGVLMAELDRDSGTLNDGNTGELRIVNTGNAGLSGGGNDDLPTDNDGAPPHYQDFAAMAFRDNGNGSWELYAVNNNRYDMDTDPADVNDGRPALWEINQSDGSAVDENGNATGRQPFAYLNGISGRVTGLEFDDSDGDRMYAVDDDGYLYHASFGSSTWTRVTNLNVQLGGATPNFSGLTFGPRNLDVLNNRDEVAPFGVPDESPDGNPAVDDVLFASTATGEIYAFYTNGMLADVFDSNDDGIADTFFVDTGASSITGLAFSTLDYNLWHPTMNRRDDPGHGVNEAFDISRSNTTWVHRYNSGDRAGSENEGGASFYFGMEPWVSNPDTGSSTSYFDDYWTGNNNAQLGLTEASHRDINANSGTHFTYDMPGGAYGRLVTNSFSLAGSVYEDKPTLYFNYFLETEETNVRGSAHDNMRDSARVFISNDGGETWELLATNNSDLTTNVATAELPWYLSTSARPSLDDAPADRQQVQELYDNTGVWRQARVDLGNYAGDTNLMIRFDFSTAGVSPGSYDQVAGEDTDIWWDDFTADGWTFGDISDEERGQDNSYEGFYVDDIIIGYAERGEMVTRHDSVTSNPTSFYTIPQNPETGAPNEILEGDYQLEIRRGTEYADLLDAGLPNITVVSQFHTNERMIPQLGRLGDENLARHQDQLILEGNTIRDSVNYGISVDAGARDLGLILPSSQPGGVIKTPVPNNDALVPGVVIMNNVIAKSGAGGIFFSGDAGSPDAPVPMGRIINNTIAGDEASRSTYGIRVTENASPTILNNVITSANTAISIDSSSSSTVVGYNLFKDYGSIGTLGSHPIDMDLLIANDDDIEDLPLFVDPLNYNYYLASGALAIDSSLDVLGERSDFEAVKSSLSIPPSPIIAPEWDRYGQLRQDDPAQSPPSGMGAAIFKDRGAVERADFTGPTAFLADPLDDQVPRVETTPKVDGQFDYNDTVTDVVVINRKTTDFAIQLQALEGIGLDDTSVNPLTAVTVYRVSSMDVFEDPKTFPRPLKQGATEDYVVRFDEINDVLHVIPTAGVWETGAYYVIRVNNSASAGVKDQAGNPLQPTRSGGPFDGQAIFTAHLTGLDFGDLPDGDYETLLNSGAQGGARHVVTAGMYLGSPPSVELNGQPHAKADADMYDDGVTISSALQLDAGHLTGQFTVYASAEGYLNAWIDFNDDGMVDGANERIFLNQALTPGYNTLSIDMTGVNGAMGGDLSVDRFARFRFTSESFTEYAWLDGTGEAGFEGLAYDGEVEDYLFEITNYELDWGDAPTNLQTGSPLYPTLSYQNGARHYITGPYLGNAAPDAELDGQPTALATGDDSDGNNDDDGVIFVGGSLVPGDYQSQVGLMVGNVASDAYVEAWIDFNGDGIWADEWATTGQINPDGDHDAFTITAERPGQEGTGIRVQFHEDTAFSVNYDGTDRILHVQFIPDTTTAKEIVDAINGLGEPIVAEFADAGTNTGAGKIQDLAWPEGIPDGRIVPTTGGDFADPATTGVINPMGANNAFEIYSTVIDGSANGPTIVFEHVANPGDRTTAVWDQGANTLTITFEPDVTQASDIVAKVDLSGAPLTAELSGDPNLGEGVIAAGDSKIYDDAEYVLDGAYERILTNEKVIAGYQVVSFMVPADAVSGQTFARFRVTSTGKASDNVSLLGVGGLANDGEVEDYAVTIERVDFGDAIDVYNTTLTRDTAGTLLSDGARHVIYGPRLGNAVDHDINGAPSFWANGDDLDTDPEPGDDEDGVAFDVPGTTPQIVPGGPVGIDVTLGHDGFDGRASVTITPSAALQNDRFTIYAADYGTDLNGVNVQFDLMEDGFPHTGVGTISQTSIPEDTEYTTTGGSGGTLAQTPVIDPVGLENAFQLVAKMTGTLSAGITVRFVHGDTTDAVWNNYAAPVDPRTLIITFNPDDDAEPGATTIQELIAAVDAAGSPLEVVLAGDKDGLPVVTYNAPILTVAYNEGATTTQIVDAINNQTTLFTAELDLSNPMNDGSDDVSTVLDGHNAMLAGGEWPAYLDRASMTVDPAGPLTNDQFIIYAATYGTDLNNVVVQFDRMDDGLPHTGQGTIPLAEDLPANDYSTSGGGGGGFAQTPLIDPVGSENAFRFVAKTSGTANSGITVRFQHGPAAGAVWIDGTATIDPKTLIVTFNPDDGSGTGATKVQELIDVVNAANSPLELVLEGDKNALPVASYTDPTLTITYNAGATTAQIVDAINTQTTLFTAELDMSVPTNDGSDDVSVALNGHNDLLAGGDWPGYLDAWFDVNGDGVFQETTDERIFTAQPLVLGVNSLSFDVPAGTPVGYKYLRFRVTDNDSPVGPDGLEMSGEVEDYMVIVQRFDFGDAPDSYGTLLDSNGARHVILGPTLGTAVDHDQNGIPNENADGDDTETEDPFLTTGGDDEDGIQFVNGGLIPGHEAEVEVLVNDDTVGVTSALVEAWIDFNGDGVWTDEWATVTINPDGSYNEFSVTAQDPGQVGTGIRVRFLVDTVSSVAYDPVDRILDVRYIPDTTTIGEVVDSINTSALPVVAQLLGASDPDSVLASSDTTVTDGAEFVLDGAYERIFTNLLVDESNTEPFKFMVPNYAVPGQTYARFRVTSDGLAEDGSLLGADGLALNGEVEDYTLTINAIDYGDAPDSYQTLRDDDGARHVIDVNGPYLGAGVDHDPDGIPTAGANSDDYFDFNDDEDGVTFSSLLWIGASQKASYEVVAPEGGELDVWIDFNGDGIWDHATEHLQHQTLAVTDDPQPFEFNVPDTGFAGQTYVRVRITSDGMDAAGNPLTPTGLAADGEVEDYLVYLNPSPVAVIANGPYWINTNENLVLDATGSTADDRVFSDATDSIVLYEWDFTYDPTITDPTDERSEFNAEYTTTSAIDVLPWPWYQIINVPEPDAAEPLAVYLRVVDSLGAYSDVMAPSAKTELRIFDNEPTAEFSITGAVNTTDPFMPGEELTFDATASRHDRHVDGLVDEYDDALERRNVKYEWDFDYDGTFNSDKTEVAWTWDDVNDKWVEGPGDEITTWTYQQFGQYTAVLRVTDSNDPAKTDVYSMTVNVTEGNQDPVAVPIPAADPYGYYVINMGDALSLDGSDSKAYTAPEESGWGDNIVSWQWDLNYDGVTFDPDVTGEKPEVPWYELDLLGLAPAVGGGYTSHTVALLVEDSFGYTHMDDSAMLYIHENRPHAVATSPATPLNIAPGDAVTFDASNSWHDRDPSFVTDHAWPTYDDNAIVSFEWDLHYDGTFDAERIGAVVTDYQGYALFGEYTAMLRVTDANGAYDMLQFDIIADQDEDPPVPITGGPYTVATGGDIQLNASASYDPEDANHDDAGDAIVSYKWTLAAPGGDLEIVTASPFYTLTWEDHLSGLTAGDDYTLTLEVTDKAIPGVIDADTVSATTLLKVRDNAVTVDLAVTSHPGLEVTRGADVTFVATAENPYGTPIDNYLWDFDYQLGDWEADPAASGNTATHAFTNFGTYSVAVIAEDSAGKWAMDVVQITANGGASDPVADAGSTHTHDVAGDAYYIDVGDDLYLNAENSSAGGDDADYGDSIQYFWDLDNDGQYDDATGQKPEITSAQLDILGLTDPGQYSIGLKVTDVYSASGGPADAFDNVPLFIFNNQPTAAIVTTPFDTTIGRTTPVKFDGTSSKSDRPDREIVKYEWDFDGDGLFDGPNDVIQDDPNAAGFGIVENVTFPMFQVYNVTLRVTDDNTPGKTDTETIQVTVSEGNQDPNAVLVAPQYVETGYGITLNGANSTDPDALYGDDIVGYTWSIDGHELLDFADQPTITVPWDAPIGESSLTGLALAGRTDVEAKLTVTDKLGNTDVAFAIFGIYDNEPLPDFTATPNPVAYDVDVEFDASTSSHTWPDEQAVSITKYEWDFNYDGEEANFDVNAEGMETTHSYSLFGDYVAALRVTDSNGKMAISVLTIEVSQGNHDPTAVAGGPYVFASGQAVALDASASFDDDANHGDSIVEYAWDLDNDGLYETVLETPTTTMTVDPQDVDKVLPIALRVKDSQGGFGYDTTTVEVVTNVPPTADAGGPYTLIEGTPFQLDGTGSQDDGLIISYEWDLDYDGTTFNVDLTGAQPTVTFDDDMASQTIALRVKDAGDKTDIHTTTLTVVNADPVASIDTLPTGTIEGQGVTITGQADDLGELDSHTFDWTVTLGGTEVATGSGQDISFVPQENGDYEVTLTVTDDDGGDHTVTDTLTVSNAAPAAGSVTVTPITTIDGQTLIADGQEVTVSGTFTDPGTLDTHTVAINWGDGTTTNATVDQAAGTYQASHTFAAGGEYTIVATVTDDDNGSHQADADVNVVHNLGVVDFRDDLNDLDPSYFPKGIWFKLTAAHNGLLTTELGGTGASSANVSLFDEGGLPVNPLPNGPSDGSDFLVPAGEHFYLWLTGTAADVDVRLTNLVSVIGSAVTVLGTDQNDAFEFELTDSYFVRINGTQYHFADGSGVAETVTFDGGLGDDTATFTGSAADESARFFTGNGEFYSGSEVYDETGFFVDATAENLIAYSEGGRDFIKMYDSPGDDLFTASPREASLVGPGYSHEGHDFYVGLGYATNREGEDGKGGADQAILNDSAGNDKFKLDWADAKQFFGKLYGGSYYSRGKNFESIDATATDGNDLAVVIGSPADDEFFLKQGFGHVTNDRTDVDFLGFDSVIAYAGDGYDVARFEDSAGNDDFRGRSHKSTMIGTGYDLAARNFEEVFADAKNGGYDRAKLHDTSLDNILHAEERSGQTWAQLAVDGAVEDPLYEVLAFDFVKAYATEGDDKVDRAEEYDWLFLDGEWTDE